MGSLGSDREKPLPPGPLRRQPAGRFVHSSPQPMPAVPHPPPPASPPPSVPPPKPRSTRRETAGRTDTAGRTTRAVPVAGKKNNTLLLVGGVGGGIFLIIILIAVAASSGSRPPRPVEKKHVAAAPVEEAKSTVTRQDTGPITFACEGGGQHPEKEQAVTRCPKCDARSRFFWDYKADKFSCFQCKALFDKADIKCPECGRVPARSPYIKHRPG